MKQMIFASVLLAGLGLQADEAGASSLMFADNPVTGDTFFDGAATFDYDPLFLGGSIFDANFLVDIALSPDLSTGSLTLFDGSFATLLDGSLQDTMLSVDNGIGDDSFSMLFSLTVGSTPFAVATFTGDLDGLGTTAFLSDGVFFTSGDLSIEGATVVPLPASILLLGSGIAALCYAGTRRKTKRLQSVTVA